MTRRAPLLVLGDPGSIASGLAPDRHPLLRPLWDVAQNARFYQGKVRRLLPHAQLFAQSNPAYFGRGLHQQQNSDGIRWVFSATVLADVAAVIKWYGPAPTAVYTSVVTGLAQNETATAQASQLDFTQWGDWTLFCFGEPQTWPVRYRPVEGVDTLPNAPKCIQLMKKQNQLIAIGTGLNRRGVSWSDADDITLWAAAADNLAGSLTIEEFDTPIRGAARLGQNIAVYTEDQMGLVYYIGQPFIFGQRVALDGIGVVGKAAVCADRGLNYGVSRNGCWQTDGNDYRYIDQGVLSDYLQKNVNWAQGSKIVVARNDVTRCIEFHFPMGANVENTEAWSFDPAIGAWGKVTAYHAMQERKLFSKPIVANSNSVFLLDSDPTAAAPLSLITKPLIIDQPEYPGLHVDARIDEVEIAALTASNVEFRISNAEDIDGPWADSIWQTVSPDLRTYRMPNMPTGTYHRLEFRSTATNWDLDLQGAAFFGFVEGTKRDNI